ncbi:MAG: TetR/AcrR family transcriptional regulator [Terrimesophilobacter sp.]
MTSPIPREARREQLVQAATTAFAQKGYYGTSTAQVAAEAGVSQPYIIQVFGTKEALFLEVHKRAGSLVSEQMRTVAASAFDMTRFTEAYRSALIDRTLLLVILQGFAASSVPAIGHSARKLFSEMYEILRDDAGATPDQARDFLARGILINTVLAIGIQEHIDDNPWVKPLLDVIFPES